MANKLKTKTHEFDCDYCSKFDPTKQIFVRLKNTNISEIVSVFTDTEEISDIKYSSKEFTGITKLSMIRDEGSTIFLTLE